MVSKFKFVFLFVVTLSSLSGFQVFNNGKAYIEKSKYQKKVLELKKKFLKGEQVSQEVDNLLYSSPNTKLGILVSKYVNDDTIVKSINLPNGTAKVSLDIIGLKDTDGVIVYSKKNISDEEAYNSDTFYKDGNYELSSDISEHRKALDITYIQPDGSKENDVQVNLTFYEKFYDKSLIGHYLSDGSIGYDNLSKIGHKFSSTDHGFYNFRYVRCLYRSWERFPSWRWGWRLWSGFWSYITWTWRLVTRSFSCIRSVWHSQFGYSNFINKHYYYIGVDNYRYVVELYGITDDSDDFISINGEKYSGNLNGKKLYLEDHKDLMIKFYTDYTGWTNDIPGVKISRKKIIYKEIR